MNIISNVDDYVEVLNKIKNNFIQNFYVINSDEFFFHNDFNYTIKKVIPEELKDINQYVFFGNNSSMDEIVMCAKKFPMIGERQLIIVKDGNKIFKNLKKLTSNIKSIPKSSVIVFYLNGAKIDSKKKEINILSNHGVVYDFKKIYENKISGWIKYLGKRLGFNIDYKLSELIVERTGINLSKIDLEFKKIKVNINQGNIDNKVVLEHFGINNDFNLFELQNEIGKKNFSKVFKISNYFTNNSAYSIQQILATLHNYFSNIFKIQSLKTDNPNSISKLLGINYYFVNDYLKASKNFSIKEVVKIIRILNKYDLKSKGINYEGNSDLLINQLIAEIKD
mgnify:CR=1 FL=1